MSSWREKEWKIPRKGEVVKDPDGNLGWVLRTEGTLTERYVWVEDVKGTEIYTKVPSEIFERMDNQVSSDFHKERYMLKGYKPGAICSFRGNTEVPLLIIQLDWSFLRDRMIFCLQDMREFDGEIMKTENDENLVLMEGEYPPLENIVRSENSGASYRLEVSLVEKTNGGWETAGSPWEFFNKEDALSEVECWKSRLIIRRVSSVLSSSWKNRFPCWTVEVQQKEDKILTRVRKVEAANGAPGYFETSLQAALASKIVPSDVWYKAFFFSQDGPIV